MKKFFTLLFSSLFSLSLLAYDGSRLSISTVSNSMDLKVEIDGRKVTMQNNTITLGNITEGSHNVKIYKEKKRNGFSMAPRKRQELIYSGSVFVKRGFHTDITVNRFGKVFIDERRIQRYDEWYDEDEDYGDDGGWDHGYDNVMNTRDFEQVKEQISKEWFEKNRLTSARVIMDRNNFTTRQIQELMLLFTLENNKLEVAKYAYRKTVDKHNYHRVNEALTFKSSKEELARFIRDSR